MKKVFTTTKVGKFCGVTQQTVIKWVDSGLLRGFRLPNSRDRRVTETALLKFMKKHSIPTEVLDDKLKTRVLVVDDEETVGKFFEALFQDEKSVALRVVTRGFDAGIVRDWQPDVVFLDIMLPDIDGRRVCELIRQGAGGRRMAIVGISGYASSLDVKELERSGFDDFLPKPFDAETVKSLLARHTGDLKATVAR
ncbi:MAG: response regulator [Planctomycetota bacterium]